MGIYDFFKGKCPSCFKQIDNHPEFGICGNIQTKYFIDYSNDECFRNFYPGDKVPFAPGKNLIIGRTCCCNSLLKAIFNNDILVKYEKVNDEQ